MANELFRFPSAEQAATACGDRILELLAAARGERGVAMLAVSGGSTPRAMFQYLAGRTFDWTGVELFWVDERMAPPADSQSNFRMTREALLDAIPLPAAQIHRIKGELTPDEAARE